MTGSSLRCPRSRSERYRENWSTLGLQLAHALILDNHLQKRFALCHGSDLQITLASSPKQVKLVNFVAAVSIAMQILKKDTLV